MDLHVYYEETNGTWKISFLEYKIGNMPYCLNIPDNKPIICVPNDKGSLRDNLKDWVGEMDSYLSDHLQSANIIFENIDS